MGDLIMVTFIAFKTNFQKSFFSLDLLDEICYYTPPQNMKTVKRKSSNYVSSLPCSGVA